MDKVLSIRSAVRTLCLISDALPHYMTYWGMTHLHIGWDWVGDQPWIYV
jgi:hypothetical protein